MSKQTVILTGILCLISFQTHAKGGGDRPRPETISCGLFFEGATVAEAQNSVLVQNAQALLKGESRGVTYVFSVRGKTAVARLTDSTQVVSAQGAIEMLRHGGEDRSAPARPALMRRGEDDANDGAPEREAGFQLSVASPQNPNVPKISLKCESINQTQN